MRKIPGLLLPAMFPLGPLTAASRIFPWGGVASQLLAGCVSRLETKLKVKFALDKEPPETIEKEVLVKGINDNYIGCEFIEESGFSDRTLGFYLMK
jgi:hypothetical protein